MYFSLSSGSCVCVYVRLSANKKRTCRSENLQPALPQSRTCCIFFGPAFHWPARCVEPSLFQRQATMSLGCRSSSSNRFEWILCKQLISLDDLVSIRSGFSSFFKASLKLSTKITGNNREGPFWPVSHPRLVSALRISASCLSVIKLMSH